MRAPQSIGVRSPSITPGRPIPREFTAFGDDVSPALNVTGVPEGTVALAIVVDDADGPGGGFTHWTVWNLPGDTREIPQDADVGVVGGVEGTNDFGFAKYMGPKPPSGTHHYHFRVFALEKELSLPRNAKPDDVWRALAGNVRAWGELVGTSAKP